VAELSPADPEPAPQQRRLILHLGTLYGDRKIDNFCQAISRLVAQGDVDPSSFKVLFAGVMEKSIVDAARQSAPELVASGAIEFRSRMPWEEAQRLLRRSSTALLIQGHHQQGLPAKLFEYIAAGKRIFAVVDGGAVGRLLDELKIGCWADPDDVSAMAARLREFMEAPALSPDEVRARGQQYDFRSLAEHLAELISAVAVQPVRS